MADTQPAVVLSEPEVRQPVARSTKPPIAHTVPDEELRAELRWIARRVIPTGPLLAREVELHTTVSVRTLKRRFGPSWNEVLTNLGLADRYSGRVVSPLMLDRNKVI